MAQERTEEDGEGVMEYEVTSPTSKRILAEAQAAKVARRLLGPNHKSQQEYICQFTQKKICGLEMS